MFDEIPTPLTEKDKETWLHEMSGVALASDAFFPFRDNIDRARLVSNKSSLLYVMYGFFNIFAAEWCIVCW